MARKKILHLPIREIEKALKQGVTVKELAKKYNCSPTPITKIKKNAKIKYSRNKDLTGQKFNMLLVLRKSDKKTNKNIFWICQCDCGKIIEIQTSSVKNKNSHSCVCYKRAKCGDNHKNWDGIGELSRTFYHNIKNLAKRREIIFSVSIEYLWELYLLQDKKCVYTGDELIFPLKSIDSGSRNRTASLDRIDSTKGYIEGNVQWVHKDINMMKQGYNEIYFIGLCDKVSKYKGKI